MTTEKRKKLLQAMRGMSMADAVVEKKPKKKGQYSLAVKNAAMELYLQGTDMRQIAEELALRFDEVSKIDQSTVSGWARKHGWDEIRGEVQYEIVQETKHRVKDYIGKQLGEIEEVRQEYLDRMRTKEGADIRGHEFAKLTEMQSKLQALNADRESVVEHISKCIEYALDESEMPMPFRQKFLMAYVSRLEEGL
tara:strand:+ start:12638 stop:13219 length:582 start_codon:yes stop_codon:yes gene_type:complete